MNKVKLQKLRAAAIAVIFIAIISWWLSSTYFFATENIPWSYQNVKKARPEYASSLTTAKTWATQYYKNEREIIRFEYSIWEHTEGFEVMISAIYKGGMVAIDGEMCVLTNKSHKFIKAKQCMAPDDLPAPS